MKFVHRIAIKHVKIPFTINMKYLLSEAYSAILEQLTLTILNRESNFQQKAFSYTPF